MPNITVKFPPKSWKMDIDPSEDLETVKIQIFSLSMLEPERMALTLVGYGPLTEATNLSRIDWEKYNELHVCLKVDVEAWQDCCTLLVSKSPIA